MLKKQFNGNEYDLNIALKSAIFTFGRANRVFGPKGEFFTLACKIQV